jgi:uncharacterized protein
MAMFFNVSGLVQEGIGATRRYDLEGELRREDGELERVAGEVEFLRTRAGVLVRAHLNLVEPEVCSRCLEPLEEKVPIEFEEEFQATVDVHTGHPVSEKPSEDAFLIDAQHTLDLTEAIRQYREASATMQPLCRPDCRGLCPDCGRDLNTGDCNCGQDAMDGRWAALSGLRTSGPEGKE